METSIALYSTKNNPFAYLGFIIPKQSDVKEQNHLKNLLEKGFEHLPDCLYEESYEKLTIMLAHQTLRNRCDAVLCIIALEKNQSILASTPSKKIIYDFLTSKPGMDTYECEIRKAKICIPLEEAKSYLPQGSIFNKKLTLEDSETASSPSLR